MVYREVCEAKWSWDAQIEGDLADRWKLWEESLPVGETVPRSLAPYHKEMKSMSLHAFGDASNKGVCATVYVIVEQSSGTTQTLVAAKSRLAKFNHSKARTDRSSYGNKSYFQFATCTKPWIMFRSYINTVG